MPYTRPYSGGFQDFPNTGTPINAAALNTIDLGAKAANDQIQTLTTTQRNALTPTIGQMVWDSTLNEFFVYLNSNGGNAWQGFGNSIICTSTTRPLSPFNGQHIYETDTRSDLIYTGTAWVQTSSTFTASGATGVSNLIIPPSLRLERGTTFSVANATDTFLSWPAEVFDTDGMYTATSDTITAQTAGIYQINVTVSFATNATGVRVLSLCKNTPVPTDATKRIASAVAINASAAAETILSCSTLIQLVPTDTIKVHMYQTSGGALNVANTGSPQQTNITMVRVGRTS